MEEHKIIAIDVGHCENAGTSPVPEYSSSGDFTSYKVDQLVIQKKDQIILSQIFLSNEQMQRLKGKIRPTFSEIQQLGDIYFGNEIPVDISDGERFCYFKVPPEKFDDLCGKTAVARQTGLTHGQVMACFIHAMVNSIFKYNASGNLTESDRPNVNLMIGCPSTDDWEKDEALNEYADLVKRATNVHDVRIIPESRAAIFSSLSSKESKISAVNGVVVFDFGSSTADCTYMLLGRKRIEFSYALGASEIERAMTLLAMKDAKSTNSRDVLPNAFVKVENTMRDMKERFYSHKIEEDGEDIICKFSKSVKSVVTIDGNFLKRVTERVQFNVKRDSQELRTGSWRSLAREFFQEAKSRINNSTYYIMEQDGKKKEYRCSLDTIILTGGASNMDFLYEDCKSIFPGVKIVRENNTSYTVATGLSWVAISDLGIPACIEEAKRQLDSSKCYNSSRSYLCENLSDSVFKEICEIVEEEVRKWADLSEDTSAAYLKEKIDERLRTPNTIRKFEEIFNEVSKTWKENLSNNVCNAVNAQAKKLYTSEISQGIMLPVDLLERFQTELSKLESVNISSIFSHLDLTSVINQLIKNIIVIVIWAVALSMAIGTFGLSLLAGAFAHGIADAAISDEDLSKPRSKDIRTKAASSIVADLTKKKDELMQEFNDALLEQTSDFDEALNDVLDTAFKIITLKLFDVKQEIENG